MLALCHFHSAFIVRAATCRSVDPTGTWIAGTVNSLVLMAAGSTQVKFRGREATVLAEEMVWLRPPHLDHDLQTHEKGAAPVMNTSIMTCKLMKRVQLQ